MQELHLLAVKLTLDQLFYLTPIPIRLKGHTHWKYGTGEHSSPVRRIPGPILLTVRADCGRDVNTGHMVLEGSTKWVIGRNVTRNVNIEHIGRTEITFVDEVPEAITLTNQEFLRYVRL